MAIRHKKGLKGSIDDVLSDLLGDDDDTPKFPIKSNKPASFGSSGGRPRGVVSQVNKKDPLDDDFFSKMAHEKETEAEDPDISDVDPEALLETLKDMDDMEADLLGIKKTNSQKPVKDVEKSQHLSQPTKSGKKTAADEKGDSISGMDKKTSSAPATSKQLMQKLSFEDVDDPLAGLLSDEEDDMVKKVYSSATKSTPETNAGMSKEKGTSLPSTPGQATQRKREELVFEGDGNDLMDALGFGDSSRTELKAGRKGDVGEPRPARSMLDELLGRGTDTKRLERQNTGEAKEFKLDKKYKKQADKEDNWADEFTFGAYQPTVALAPEGQQSRRQSVRFSSENLSELKTDQRSKPSTSVSASPIRSKGGADWLGLKDEDFDSPPSPPPKAFSKGSVRGTAVGISSSPSDDEHPLPTRSKPSAEEGTQKPEPVKDDSDSWLSHVLSQKKSQAQEKVEEKREKRAEPSDPVQCREEVASVPVSSHPATSTQKQQQSGVLTNRVPTLEESGPSMTLLNVQEQAAPVVLSSATKRIPFADIVKAAPAASLQGVQEGLQVPTLTQLLHLEPLVLSSTTSGENEKKMASMQAQFQESVASYQAELLSAQTRLVELEGQVRRLELEKNQQKLLLESLQQRYQDDLELIENAHRNRVKVVEDSYRQREERLRQENQELAEQCLSQCQSAEQAKSELLAQHQRRITEMEQEKVKEIDRLQELQRLSILQMHKDHEEQLQRLKRLKDQEMDAVTTATSYTRSLNGIIEQMEEFSSNLNDLSNKVEATHHTTSEGLEIGVRQREQQHRVLQDRLARQQRDMEEERNRLQEVISKMEARLNEQTRLLEQERWRATAEQSKVAALQHSLEEQRRVLTQQLAMEREELERAKNALLEEQKSVMQKCAAERHRLAVEWSEFHTQQRLSKERTEREVDRALQIDSQREGAIMSLAKEQADLKIKASELRSKEEQLAREREILEQEKQQLRLEKEKVNAAALHIKQRADEIDSMSKLSSQRYGEGEQALLEARKVESEHQARLQAVQRQMEQLRQQEEHLHQERLSLSHQRRQLEQLRDSLSSNPLLFQTTPQMPLPGTQAKIISNVQYLPVPATDLPKVDLGNFGASQDLPVTGPVDLYAKLVLHKLTADRDNDFLEEERFFLETLKKASYKTSSQIA